MLDVTPARSFSRASDNTASVRIRCPYCSRHHTHGAGTPDAIVLGERRRHCRPGEVRADAPGAYFITDPLGLAAVFAARAVAAPGLRFGLVVTLDDVP